MSFLYVAAAATAQAQCRQCRCFFFATHSHSLLNAANTIILSICILPSARDSFIHLSSVIEVLVLGGVSGVS